MAMVKTIKELAFDMLLEDMPSIEMLSYYNKAAKKYRLPEVKLNIYRNIKTDIDEELYCKEDPFIVVENSKTISITYLDFVSKYFTAALPYILRDYNIYDDADEIAYEEIMRKVVSKSKKLQEYDIEILTDFVMDEKRDISLNGCMTTDMLLEKLIECDEEGAIEDFRDNY
jgi:hypothetical protein